MANEVTMSGGTMPQATNAMAMIMQSREMVEAVASMQMAKAMPRDRKTILLRLQEEAKDETLAISAEYLYAKGGTEVSGLSIRAAEALARAVGNMTFGIRELEQRNGESTCEAFCWDLETNTRESKVFQVSHIRHTRDKGDYILTDPREIYELVANNGARRERACILGIVPIGYQEHFAELCDATLKARINRMIEKRGGEDGIQGVIEQMLKKLEDTYKVTRIMVCEKFQKQANGSVELATKLLYGLQDRQIMTLYRIMASLNDGIASPADFFKGASRDRVIVMPQNPNGGEKKPATDLGAALAAKKPAQLPQNPPVTKPKPMPVSIAKPAQNGSKPKQGELNVADVI